MKAVKVMDTKHLMGFFRRSNHDGLFTIICLVFLTLILTVIPSVYANDDEAVNIMQFPDRLSAMMGIPLFAGQILATALVTLIFTAIPILAKNIMGTVIMGIISFSLCLALGWLPLFLLVILVLMIVVLLGAKMRDWIGGRGGGD